MWRYVHARTVVRLLARLNGPIPDHTAQLQRFLRHTIEGLDSVSILQVGAYDGVSNDSVHDLLQAYQHVRAVLLEPQPGPYAALQKITCERRLRSNGYAVTRVNRNDTLATRSGSPGF